MDINEQLESIKTGRPVKVPKKKPVAKKKEPVEKPAVVPQRKKIPEGFELMRIRELRKTAKKAGIRSWSRKTRRGLVSALKLKKGKYQ